MSSYQFPNVECGKVAACHIYVKTHVDWASNFEGVSSGPLTVYTTNPLTDIQLAALTILMNAYVDPEIFLVFDHADTLPLHSHFNTDIDNVEVGDKNVIQTFIYSTLHISKPTVLDGIKTIVEYYCPNVQDFHNTTSGSISLEIYDISRDVSIATNVLDLGEIGIKWNELAKTGNTGGNTVYRSTLFSGLMNKSPDYDVALQLRGSTTNPDCQFRCNSLQFLYYNLS